MEHAEVFRYFLILTHGVGDARPGVDAGKRGSDQSQKHRNSLDQHERSAVAGSEQRIADHYHHVSNGRRGASRVLHRVSAI